MEHVAAFSQWCSFSRARLRWVDSLVDSNGLILSFHEGSFFPLGVAGSHLVSEARHAGKNSYSVYAPPDQTSTPALWLAVMSAVPLALVTSPWLAPEPPRTNPLARRHTGPPAGLLGSNFAVIRPPKAAAKASKIRRGLTR